MAPAIIESVAQRYMDHEEVCPFLKMCPKVISEKILKVYERLDEKDYIKEIIKDKPSEW